MPRYSVTASNSQLNRLAPHADRAIIVAPCAEAAVVDGVTTAKIHGKFNTNNAHLAGTYADTTMSGASDGGSGVEAPYLNFSGNVANLGSNIGAVPLFTAGADQTWKEFTIIIRAKSLAATNAAQNYLFHRGAASTGLGHVHLLRTANADTATAFLRKADNTTVTLVSGAIDWSVWHTFVLTGGLRRGFRLYIDGTLVGSDATTDPMVVSNGSTVYLGRTHSPAANSVGRLDFAGAVMLDRQLSDDEIDDVTQDPHLYFRKPPAAATVCDAVMHTACPTETTVECVLTGTYGTLAADVSWKVNYGTSKSSLGSTSSTATISSAEQRSIITLTGLTPGTRYYLEWLWSVDGGTTWNRGPTAVQTFKTDPGIDGTVTFAITSDAHGMNSGGGTPDPLVDGFGANEFYRAASANRKAIASYYADLDLYRFLKPDLVIDLGDTFMLDAFAGSLDAASFKADAGARAMKCKALHFQRALAGPVAWVDGNHEMHEGYQLRGDEGSEFCFAPLSIRCLKRHRRNPGITTYAKHLPGLTTAGENEGVPTDSNYLTWLPPLGFDSGDQVYDATWRRANVLPYASDCGSPRETIWYMRYGPVDLIAADSTSYNGVGDLPERRAVSSQEGDHLRSSTADYQLGDYQWDELERILAHSRAPHKLLLIHNLFGANPIGDINEVKGAFYGRESGRRILSTSQGRRLHALAKKYKAIIVHGHDHKFAMAKVRGVWIISAPSTAAPSLTVNTTDPGWNSRQFNNEYGTAETGPLGQPNILNHDGETVAEELLCMHNILGYLVVTASPTAISIRCRQTEVSRAAYSSAVSDLFVPRHVVERHYPTYTASGGSVTLSEAYRDVLYASEALTSTWWSSPPTDRSGTDIGFAAYPFDQPGSTTRALSGVTSGAVGVAHVPRYASIGEASGLTTTYTLGMSGYDEEDPTVPSAPVIGKRVDLGSANWAELADETFVGTGTIKIPSTNSDDVAVDFDGSEVDYPPDSEIELRNVDWNRIRVKGSSGDVVCFSATGDGGYGLR